MLPKDILIEQIRPSLKTLGFKKKGTTWILAGADTSVVFNIQGSQYDNGVYYINLGTSINILNTKKTVTISSCQIWQRLDKDIVNSEYVINAVKLWIEWYGDVAAIKRKVSEGKMPRTTKTELYGYLQSI